MRLCETGNFLSLSLAEEACGPDLAEAEGTAGDHIDSDRLGKASGLFDPGFHRAQPPIPNPFGHDEYGTLAARYATVFASIENAQSSSPGLVSPPRLSGWPGCIVEMACL